VNRESTNSNYSIATDLLSALMQDALKVEGMAEIWATDFDPERKSEPPMWI
jgi:hypothetical protein